MDTELVEDVTKSHAKTTIAMETEAFNYDKPLKLKLPYNGRREEEFSYMDLVSGYGTSFCLGTICGFFYHFKKGFKQQHHIGRFSPQRLAAGLNAGCLKSPRVGGFLALLNVLWNASEAGLRIIRGKGLCTVEDAAWVSATSGAVSGAAMWAPRGLRSASRAALGLASFSLLLDAHSAHAVVAQCMEKYLASPPEPYTYPYYRPQGARSFEPTVRIWSPNKFLLKAIKLYPSDSFYQTLLFRTEPHDDNRWPRDDNGSDDVSLMDWLFDESEDGFDVSFKDWVLYRSKEPE